MSVTPRIATMQVNSTTKAFGGKIYKLSHESSAVKTPMKLNVFIPNRASGKAPVIYYLAGLTCTGDNGLEKGFFTASAALHGIAIVFPDTSPRGAGIKGEDDAYDFGTGAGFYLDATREPWSKNYRMESYITKELPEVLAGAPFSSEIDLKKASIMGHSMGGHGALTLFLRHPGLYKSVSAFSPISNPMKCPWGQKAFSNYLADESEWPEHDASVLLSKHTGPLTDILVDCGRGDGFYKDGQLLPESLVSAAQVSKAGQKVLLRMHDEYDHSYFFISSFSADHIAHHATHLQ